MTVSFAAVIAVCLALLAALALSIDATSQRRAVTDDVTERAGGLARAVYFDGGTLHLEPLREDELAVGTSFLAVYRIDASGRVTATPAHLPRSAELPADRRDALIDAVLEEQGASDLRGADTAGRAAWWAAAPVWDDDAIGAVVVVGQDVAAGTAAHDRLATGLAIGCLVLLAAAVVAGHVLSGRAMRPAVAALDRQEQFLREAGHELRTPLTALRLSIEGTPTPTLAAREQALTTVDRLDHLLAALLTRARIDAGTFTPERVPLRLDQIVEQVVDDVRQTSRVRVATEPTVVVGDPVLLAQAVRNLVDNAERHARERVLVTVEPHQVRVVDDGPGVPADRREHVLRRGTTGTGTSTSTGTGTGTGLAIVAWVAELHGGTVRLDDAPGGGLVVTVTLPAPTA
ncbi:sensor histidine kinase [Curtobacterium oceanosedimentum]|uniref:sensor histidine kinase n=1 Tax=Curtobacterium oceanosedimentum TaxID=465820 RepID=UPI001CE1628B|nr:HAMP domain-containing sensor histidine kinase [Curtobacterium oceanosedimentum]MCA5923785.1 HAMP domain-containing histidine kinase [Curtobacterium oceanosedimentum]